MRRNPEAVHKPQDSDNTPWCRVSCNKDTGEQRQQQHESAVRAGCEGKVGASGSYNEARIYDRYRTIVADALGSRVPSRLQSVSQCLFLLPDLVVLILRLLKDKRVPAKAKINLGIAFAYLTSPVDILPDLVPVLGQLDDLIIATTAIHSILRSTPESVIRENWSGSVDVLEGVQNILDAVSYIAGNKLIMRLITGFVGKPGLSWPGGRKLISNLISGRLGILKGLGRGKAGRGRTG
ncbi:MAG: DUF1232 domain-containing protein [Bacillota bacterium]